jgi:hypothetical protein
LVPVTVTNVPAGPLVGVKLVIVGLKITVNGLALVAVPAAFCTLTKPVVAPTGTVARICVPESTVNVTAETPLNRTLLAPRKFVPVIVTTVLIGPLAGVNELMLGAPTIVKSVALNPVPLPLVTLILPVDVPAFTTARI